MYVRLIRPLYLVVQKISLDKSNRLNNTLNMQETAQIEPKNGRKPTITDLNLSIMLMKAEGKRNVDIARELEITESAVSQHISKLKALVNLKADGTIDDPINASRVRLIDRLKKGEKVVDYALAKKQYKRSSGYLNIAKDFTLSMFKGLGVLVEKTENVTKIDVYAQQREDQQARIQAAKQFGLDVSKELPTVEVEQIENSVQTSGKQGQDVMPDDSPMNVSRAGKSGQPDIPPTISNNND